MVALAYRSFRFFFYFLFLLSNLPLENWLGLTHLKMLFSIDGCVDIIAFLPRKAAWLMRELDINCEIVGF